MAAERLMRAIAVIPGRRDSLHLTELPMPRVDEIPDGRGVLVRVLRCGVDGTDREIAAAEYGEAPAGSSFLVLGHESFGQVVQVGSGVTELHPGEYVVATVRRPGTSVYDRMGLSDLTTDDVYYERGISRLHGFLTEYYVDDAAYVVSVPDALREVGVLLEPLSIAEKGLAVAADVQRRLGIWRPRRAAVLGAGSLGLLATLLLRLRGLTVVTLARTADRTLNTDLVGALGARYASTRDLSLPEAAARYGPFDLIFEATGSSAVAFQAMEALGKNGVLVLASVTGGDRMMEVPADRINQGFVLGNKAMVGTVNANRAHFESAVRDLAAAATVFPGWAARLLTHPVRGWDRYPDLLALQGSRDAIKVYMEMAPLDG